MDNLVIRKASMDDLNIIQKLNNQLFELEKENFASTLVKDWPLTLEGKNYFQSLINNNYVILAILDEEIVGYLAGSINEQGSYEKIKYGEINNMFIKDTCRGFGIGKKLISCFKEYCRQNNIYNLKVTASFKNKNAIEFYRKNGFLEFDLILTTNIDKEDKNDF
ncbi:MAG TPA: GNAT family N-acetyltransferase [Candidatus Faecisoma merdavium]|nr:GNAT family N-acetyltransferase [Candidatus Faecisoma merdavium]